MTSGMVRMSVIATCWSMERIADLTDAVRSAGFPRFARTMIEKFELPWPAWA